MAELENPLAHQKLFTSKVPEASDYPVYVIVGTGPVGIRSAQKLLDYSDAAQVVIFGADSEPPYNRVKLSQYLADQISLSELNNAVLLEPDHRLAEFVDRKIIAIDRKNKTVTDATGTIQPYDKLILATGSNPLIPQLPGTELAGVFPFRSLKDTQKLIELRQQCRHICVIGGGALGLEAAAALKTQSNHVVLQYRTSLLSGLLSDEAEEYLSSALTSLGIELRGGDEINAFCGDTSVQFVQFISGESIETDAVVICTGIRPEISLAQECGLQTDRGIIVSEYMQTSDPDIYAVGECAQFSGNIYQFVRPGYEQAETCSAYICQPANAKPYGGSLVDIHLKIAHIPCSVIGAPQPTKNFTENDNTNSGIFIYKNRFKGLYRQLHIQNQQVVGILHIGNWSEVNQLRQAITDGKILPSSALKNFENDGLLWQKPIGQSVKVQPDSYLICQCNNVSKGELCAAISQGKRTLMELQLATNAGSVCGSCQPLVAELLDAPVPNLVMRHARGIFITSVVSLLLIALALLMPQMPVSGSVQTHQLWQKLWYDNFWKQVSGYSLLGFCLLTTSLSLRKRWRKISYGHVDHWRYVHSVIGCAALLILVLHTGFRLGQNLNLALMLVFLAATTTGALVGVFMARNHHWTDLKLREHRKWWSRVHYALLWALPALMGYHIFAVYYF